MTKRKRSYPRIQWVVCLNCDHEYEKEELDGLSEGCPVCESKECEPSEGHSAYKINDDWDDWR